MLKEQMHFWEKFQLNSEPRDAQGYFPGAELEVTLILISFYNIARASLAII
jgi:hypothetical protein